MSFRPIMAKWPTVTAFAEEVGAPEGAVRAWKRIDSIPAAWFTAIERAAKARGLDDVTVADLVDRAAARRAARPATA